MGIYFKKAEESCSRSYSCQLKAVVTAYFLRCTGRFEKENILLGLDGVVMAAIYKHYLMQGITLLKKF